MPFDAHQAKSLLTKNDFLAKLICLFGLQEFILFEKRHPDHQIQLEDFKESQASAIDSFEETHKLQLQDIDTRHSEV